MLLLWILLLSLLWYFIISSVLTIDYQETVHIFWAIFLCLNGVCFSYFWLNGVKDFLYVVCYFILKKKKLNYYDQILKTELNDNPKVVLAYCTCDDFEPMPLEKSMMQNYSNFETVILDDSKTEEYQKMIDEFASAHNIKVIRRTEHIGFKAGNINNYFKDKTDYDYMVILDSDEIIPPNFIVDCLRYFQEIPNIGIVQCNHTSTRNKNNFMKNFHFGVNSHWPTYQTMKADYGFMSMLGHGAMISKKAYDTVGGFPLVVAEDLCISIELRKKGYYVAFAPNIMCEEEYPIDYFAFKKRHSKWTQGNYEFIKKYTGNIIKSKMRWFEKLDIFLFTYNLPLTAFFSLFVFINIFILPLLGYNITYPIWMLIVTIIFFISPMLNDIFTWTGRMNFFKELYYLLTTYLLYGSMMWISLKASFLGIIGKKAKFLVTPKTSRKRTILDAFKENYEEFIYLLILVGLSIGGSRDIYGISSVLLIIIPIIFIPYLATLSNRNTFSEGLSLRKTKKDK